MFMLDPANFGTPLSLLQIPSRSIQRIQEKLTDPDCTMTHYSQDCRHFSDIRKTVGADDWTVARRATVDVGYICRRCHIVYPGRTACAGHQDAQCYRDGGASNSSIVKLEQMQYECAACRVKASTIAEYKTHCTGDSHRKAAAAWVRVHSAPQPVASAASRPESDTPNAAFTTSTSSPAVFNRPTSITSNQEINATEERYEDPASNSS